MPSGYVCRPDAHPESRRTNSTRTIILYMARQEGFEPPTDALEGRCSIQLSYCLILVLGAGLEPAHLLKREILSLLCLPIPPSELVGGTSQSRTEHQRIMSPLL